MKEEELKIFVIITFVDIRHLHIHMKLIIVGVHI